MRTPSSSTWRARWRASRSRSWRSEPCSGQQPSGPFSPGRPEARALQTHPAHLTTAVTRPRWGAGRGPKPRVWSARRLLPWSRSPSASGKGLAPVGSLFIVHLSLEPRAQAHQGPAGHCWLQVPPSRALPFNAFIPKGLRMLAPAVSPPYVS